MSVLATITNLKLPFPTEGVIRTAQIDDTVTPENSVQLAVNMNFDRVGAIQTRPGVTSYADVLVDGINNYGTLRNAVIPPGFDFIFQTGSTSDLSTSDFAVPSAVKVNDTKIAVFWQGPNGDGFCRNYEIDQVTGSVTPIGVPVEFDTADNTENKAILLNSSIVVNLWQGVGGAGFAQAFDVSGDTIVPEDSAYEFDSSALDLTAALVDSNHIIVFYSTASGNGFATILAINLSTFEITEPGSPFTFDSGGSARYPSTQSVGSNRFLTMWNNNTNSQAQCFLVNTGTWAITAIGTALTYGANGRRHNNIPLGNGLNFADVFLTSTFISAQTLQVNLTTYAVTAVGTALPASSVGSQAFTAALIGADASGYYFAVFYAINPGQGFVRLIQAAAGTFNMSFVANTLSGYDFNDYGSATAIPVSSDQVLLVWESFDESIGKAAMFNTFGEVEEGRFLYAASGDEVFNTTDGTWVSRRSGLAEVSKVRFSQFLNYIWMVNGNALIGGNTVRTSDGGNFGTDLVPENFPPGDFIHAGFEGRVWVANKTLGVIYYTDIVQFIPPTTYVLTYNPEVNFISQLTPQTGQSITALYRVPRALLVFTEDTIFRIYGATSVDAYPAYNVGTFSQESIIETKTGIFFHHSSGFYQFDYGSQPVEISRRIIDFVQAIPREYYENITGVYDGFDSVRWYVGPVTVEGVVFSNCCLRYTISTQVWTIYDYVGNDVTAMIYYDDGEELNVLMGTDAGKTGAMDRGLTDFGEPFYYEYIDRWRGYTKMYYLTKSASGFNVYSENAAGANLSYQKQKTGANAWQPLGTVTELNNSLMPNANTEDFDVMRLRLAGNTKGAQVVVHGIEITQLTIKGQDEN